MMKKIKVALGLSGGVDSAVSAYLLKEQGFDVSCVYLNCYDGDTPGCRGDNDRKDALEVAMNLGLPFQVLDFRKEYQAAVIDYFKKEYLLGRTPNPDVVCNRDIKFGLFLDWAVKAGFDYVATGHYAKMVIMAKNGYNGLKNSSHSNNSNNSNNSNHFNHSLLSPADLHKDQTYFLWAVPRQKFSRVLFPLGNLLKTEVREIALKIGLPVAKKKDSSGICFVGEVRVEDFLKSLGVKEKRGEVVVRTPLSFPRRRESIQIINIDSGSKPGMTKHTYEVVGRHKGVWFYTIGQRHGFEITRWPPCHPERSEAESRDLAAGDKNIASLDSSTSSLRSVARNDGVTDRPPLYVIEKDIKKNRLIVGFGAETYREKFVVSNLNWLVGSEFFSQTQNSKLKTQNQVKNSKPRTVLVRIRHGGELIPCSLEAKVNSKQGTVNSKQTIVNSIDRLPVTNYHLPFTVYLRSPQRGIAPGQSAVFYSKDGTVVGGGIIQ